MTSRSKVTVTSWSSKALWCHFIVSGLSNGNYITLSEASKRWGITERRIRTLYAEGSIEGDCEMDEKANILVIGTSGAGKSTLINTVI